MRRVQRPPAGQLATQRRAVQLAQTERRREVAQRAGMSPGVFPHVETVAVQAMGPYLGQERLHQRTPGMRRAHGVQRVRHEREIALQLPGRPVSGWIGGQPSQHEADFHAQRLVGVATAILLPHGWQGRAVALERGPQLRGDRRESLGHRQARGQLGQRFGVVVQHRPARAARGRERDLRRDERVAVPVPAHPAPQCDRRHGVGAKAAAELVLERLEQAFARARGGVEQTVFQVP